MADADPKMVLRTVYLPPELDEKLRVRAFRTNVTKGDLIRQGLTLVLEGASSLAGKSAAAGSSAAEPVNAQSMSNWVKAVAAGRAQVTPTERQELVEAAKKILAGAAKGPAVKRAAKAKAVDVKVPRGKAGEASGAVKVAVTAG